MGASAKAGIVTRIKRRIADTPRVALLVMTLFLALLFYIGIRTGGAGFPINRLPWNILVPAAAGFCLIHSWHLLGRSRAIALFLCATIISFAFEWVGDSTGWPFSHYHYTDLLGWKIGGRVPVLIPLAWYMMFYPSYIIANLLAEGGPIPQVGGRVRIIWLSLLSAAVMTAWDLTMDPVMSFNGADPDKALIGDPMADVGTPAWIWDGVTPDTPTHFGVPLQNYFGWMLTAFVVFLAYRWLETKLESAPRHGMCSRLMISLPVGLYTTMAVVDTFLGYPEIEGLRLISPFSMGFPAFFAAFQLFMNRTDLPIWPGEDHDHSHQPERPGTGSVEHISAAPEPAE